MLRTLDRSDSGIYTPEFQSDDWPVMGDAFYVEDGRIAFSIEELSTIDLKDIPSVND